MKNSNRNNKVKNLSEIILVAAICAGVAVLSLLGLLEKFDYRIYDALLGFHKNPQTCQELLFVEADDDSLKEMGPWPWPRNIIGNALLRMKEFGASSAVFDIEYLSRSQISFNQEEFEKLAKGINEGTISSEEASRLVPDFFKNEVVDNDDYFGRCIQFFGNAWLTINTLNISEEDDAAKAYAKQRCLYNNVTDIKGKIYADNRYNDRDLIKENENYAISENIEYKDAYEDLTHAFSPAMNIFISHAKGAGYTNVDIDSDGTRRRIQLLNKFNEGYAAQLVFSPLLKQLDARGIMREGSNLVILGAKLDEDSGRQNIKIPLDEHGRMLINWKHNSFGESFRHQKIYHLYYLDQLENSIAENIFTLYNTINGFAKQNQSNGAAVAVSDLCDRYDEILQIKSAMLERCEGYYEDGTPVDGGLTDDIYEGYFDTRRTFFADVKDFIHSSHFDEIHTMLAQAEKRFDGETFTYYADTLSALQEALTFAVIEYTELFDILSKEYAGSFCIVGNTGSATTDLGTTPFQRRYPNVGTHANVYNTIMNQDFIRPVNSIFGIVIGVILAMFLAFFSQNSKVIAINMTGFFMLLIAVGGIASLMIFFGVYIPLLAPALMVLLSFVNIEVMHFVKSEKDRSFLKHAFATYLNPKSVNELMAHPERLTLGGDQKHLTALFSDIKNFSVFSEKVTPIKLVNVLKTYLGDMSDCILQEGGTIDKYIGDSIVSFFGAPSALENSAWSACCSAILMKKAEARYNKINIENGYIQEELKTRIGINTGEMVVGNMGTDKKFNYTVMGTDVNIASRLEGVNKLYKSWILCSEYTWNEANVGDNIGKIVARRFDMVKVVGIDRPIQLYNILGFRKDMTQEELDAVDIFEEAMDLYLAKDFETAGKFFRKANQLVPGDESSLVYAERCDEYAAKGVAPNWNGILTMKTK